ncbi:MAG: radical SAM protein, partial [Cyanobacteria bacterium]|nr:radical SAM protein [Cyanobacteriota bacterium]
MGYPLNPYTQLPSADPSETFLYERVPAQSDAVRLAWMYPADFNIALSSLGYLTLFQQMDLNPEVAVERIYMDTLHRYQKSEAFELMGFSFSFELDTLNILKTFETFNIPFYAQDRNRDCPLVFSGGPVVITNPEPYAPFFDFYLIGEGEELLEDLIKAYQRLRHITDRESLLHQLAVEVPGVYVPSLYEISYAPEGPIQNIRPKYPDIPFPVKKRFVSEANMDHYVASTPILTENTIFSNTYLVEVMRGCAHRCRFCLASYSMLPTRGASLPFIIEKIEKGLRHTSNIGLLGALIADHPDFPELCDHLDHRMDENPDIKLSSSSLRADTLTPQIAATFKKGKQRQLTIAVESGSETLRRRINKNLKHDQILKAAETVSSVGLKGLKIYGMIGLPDETEEDVLALADLIKEIRKLNPKLDLHLGCSSFVPKAGTPFQWMGRHANKPLENRFEILRKNLIKKANFRPSSVKWDYFQAFLSRGDRRLAPLLVRYYQLGSSSLGSVHRAFKELKKEGALDCPELDWYALRERP